MIDNTQPLIISDEDCEDPIVLLTEFACPGLVDMIVKKTQVEMLHTALHQQGLNNTVVHLRVLAQYMRLKADIEHCWKVPLN